MALLPHSGASLGEMQTIEIADEDYAVIGQWEAKRGEIIFWWFESEKSYYIEVLVFPESEFELFKTGEQYLNYYDGYSFAERPDGVKVMFDDVWVLVFLNTSSWIDVTVTYVVTKSGELPPITVTETETVTKTVTEEGPTMTITATEKTVSEFFLPILLFSITLVVLIRVAKRRRK